MKPIILATAAIGLMAGTASAATDSGTITKINPKGDAITLNDGKTFTLAEGTEAESLKVGEKVDVTYTTKSGKMMATKVVVGK